MTQPRILFFDVETSPVKIWTFQLGKSYLNHSQIVEGEKFDIISIAWKFLGENKTRCLDWGLLKQDSSKMVEEFSKVIESADVVIGHNLREFDLKQINTQRLLHNQTPISWPTTEDTLKQLRKHFYLPSNRLDYVSKLLFGAGKDPMCFDDWVAIKERKDPKALAKMRKYNIKDVLLLEKLFKRIRPYMEIKAVAALNPTGCPSCGSKSSRSKGRCIVKKKVFQRRVCTSCGFSYVGRRINVAARAA